MAKTKEKKFACPECDYRAATQGAITAHVNKAHEDDPAVKLRSEFGELAPRPGGLFSVQKQLKAAPSGVPSIDYAIGIGGVPKGRIVEVFGPPKAGKTFVALTFSAHAQQMGQKAGFMDAERALQETFCELVPNLNTKKLEYGQAHGGEEALEQTRQWISTGGYNVWTIDSLRACVPRALLNIPIGDPAASAALARLLSDGLPVLDMVTSDTECTLILINHQKEKPQARFGRSWYTPGGSAPEYHCAVRLRVWASESYRGKKSGKQIGHKVKVKVEKSKVAAPHSTAEFDLFYHEDVVTGDSALSGVAVKPGIDIGSNWLSVLQEEGLVTKASNGKYVHTVSGDIFGSYNEVVEQLRDPKADLTKEAYEIVYPAAYR